MKKFLSYMLCLCLLMSNFIFPVSDVYAQSSLQTVAEGTYKGYYKIASLQDLSQVADNPSGKYVVTADITDAVTTCIETFSGELIGVNSDATAEKMRTINVNITENTDVATGLFRKVGNATFKNVKLTGSVTNEGNTNATGVGGFIGMHNGMVGTVTFENCENSATITGNTYTGGFLGNAFYWNYKVNLTNCINKGKIVGGTGGTVGGLVGISQYGCSFTNCINTGEIKSLQYIAGGLIGWSYGQATISKCYNTGNITSTATVGGLVGQLTNAEGTVISDCYNTGDLKAEVIYPNYAVGGIVGTAKVSVTVKNCYNIGEIPDNVNANEIISSYNVISTVTNCYYLSETETVPSADNALPKTAQQLSDLAGTLNTSDNIVWKTPDNLHKYSYPELEGMPFEGERGKFILDNIGYEKVTGGIYDGYYVIDSIKDFSIFEDLVNPRCILIVDIKNPVSKSFDVFSGELIGVNYEMTAPQIRTINVNIEDAVNGATGLFRRAKTGAFKNISLIGTIENTFNTTSTGVGGFVGMHNGVSGTLSFDNCENHTEILSAYRAGGFVGNAFFAGYVLKFNNCKNFGKITGKKGETVGGFIGICSYGATLTGCVNTGKIVSSGKNAGGLIGWSYGQLMLDKCYNTGNVTADAYSGGIVGMLSGSTGSVISNCYNTGTIGAISTAYSPASGILGRLEKGNENVKMVNILNCYNVGKLISATNNTFQTVHEKKEGMASVSGCYYISQSEILPSSDGTIPVTSRELSMFSSTLGDAWQDAEDKYVYSYPEIVNMPYEGEAGKFVVSDINCEKVSGGTFDGYYIIDSVDKIEILRENPSAKFVLSVDITEPVTVPVKTFSGELIGVNSDATKPEMRTVNVNIAEKSDVATGLFRKVGNATIKNISLEGSVTNTVNTNATGVGGFFGMHNSTEGTVTFENCQNNATITGNTYTGGFLGNAFFWNYKVNLTNCINKGKIVGGTGGTVGGLVGISQYGCSLINCANTGEVISEQYNAGGLIGWSYGQASIKECYNAGNITSNATAGGLIGQLAGSSGTIITDCYNTGNLTVSVIYPNYTVGGIVGIAKIATTVTNSYNIGKIPDSTYANEIISSYNVTSSVTNCYYLSETETVPSADNALPKTAQQLSDLAGILNTSDNIVWKTPDNLHKYSYPEHIRLEYSGVRGKHILSNLGYEQITEGNYTGYFVIDSVSDFSAITKNPSANFVIPEDISEAVTTPVSTFSGTLIGMNYDMTSPEMRIINVNITEKNDIATGLFRKVGSATFKNISLEGSVTNTVNTSATGVGGFFGMHNSTEGTVTFENCQNNATITGNTYTGGFLGNAFFWNYKVNLTNCINKGKIVGGTGGTVGGLIGISQYGCNLTNCANTGEVSSKQYNAGGLIGWSYGQAAITQCYNAGNITSNAIAGGLVGQLTGSSGTVITDCYNAGNLTVSVIYPNYTVGGIVGITKIAAKVTNCYNAGKIPENTYSNQIISCYNVTSTVSNCYYYSDVDTDTATDGAIPKTFNSMHYLSELLNGTRDIWGMTSDNGKYPFPEIKGMPYNGKIYMVIATASTIYASDNEEEVADVVDEEIRSKYALIGAQITYFDGYTVDEFGILMNNVGGLDINNKRWKIVADKTKIANSEDGRYGSYAILVYGSGLTQGKVFYTRPYVKYTGEDGKSFYLYGIEQSFNDYPDSSKILKDMRQYTDEGVHPRIFANKSNFDLIREQVKTDLRMKFMLEDLKEDADSKLDITEVLAFIEQYKEEGLPTGNGNCTQYTTRLRDFAFLWQITGEEKYAHAAYQIMDNLAEVSSWRPGEFIVCSETMLHMAIAYDWCYDYLITIDGAVEKIETAIYEKGVVKGITAYEGTLDEAIDGNEHNRSGWRNMETNWNHICNAGLVIAAIAVMDNHPNECSKLISDTIVSVEKANVNYAPDGGYQEGPSYWAYGTNYISYYIMALDKAMGRNYGVFYLPGLSQTCYYRPYVMGTSKNLVVPGVNMHWNYHDSGTGLISTSMYMWFAKKLSDPYLAGLRYKEIVNTDEANISPSVYGYEATTPFDLIYYNPDNFSEEIDLPLDRYFKGIETVFMRSDWNDENAIYTGLHAGKNKVNHSQLDVGNFIIDAEGIRWITDLGMDNYSLPRYYHSDTNGTRWTYYRERAESHNTLVINPDKYEDQVVESNSPIVRYQSNDLSAIAVADMTNAYGLDRVNLAKRGLMFTDNRTAIVVQDEVKLAKSSEIYWFANTTSDITINISSDGKTAILSKNGKYMTAKIVSDNKKAKFYVTEAEKLPSSPVKHKLETSNGSYKKLAIHLTEVKEMNLAVVFQSVNSANETPSYTYSFKSISDWELE